MTEKEKELVDEIGTEPQFKDELENISSIVTHNQEHLTQNSSCSPPYMSWINQLLSVKQEYEAKRRSRSIDRSIIEDEKRLRREHRIIMLGSPSGAEITKNLIKFQARKNGDGGETICTSVGPRILDVRIPISGGFTAHLFDLPSRISGRERKHWIHLARDMVSAFLFVVDLDVYCESCPEDATSNQIEEFIFLFDSVVNAACFANMVPILAFYHVELFKENLSRYPFKKYFPEYTGREQDVDSVVEYLVARFNRVVKDPARGRIPGHLISSQEEMMFRQILEAVEKRVGNGAGN